MTPSTPDGGVFFESRESVEFFEKEAPFADSPRSQILPITDT